nr:MAG TPA: hypothetical protein [Caudoviricetes sp.]
MILWSILIQSKQGKRRINIAIEKVIHIVVGHSAIK